MIVDRSIYRMAHLTLQALSAHGIHCGRGDHTHDVLLVRDANGLPALPGTSLAGVLRHALAAAQGEDTANALFGQIGDRAQPSWLTVGWALVHDSNNQPLVEGIAEWDNDPLLDRLREVKPLVRQRVRLNHRGAAADTGKFDQSLIPAGVRYTGWLGYWCDGSRSSESAWRQLLALLSSQRLRLGHGTRSGTGLFEVIALANADWDLRTPDGRKGFEHRPRTRRSTGALQPVPLSLPQPLQVTLQLRAESGWRIGGGERSLKEHAKEPDLLPQHETVVTWEGNRANLNQSWYLLPGSAVKGAVRHRLAYHYRCLTGEFAGMGIDPEPEQCPAVRALLGFSENNRGQAGILAFSDLHVTDSATGVLMHNRIDRFTGGVIKGALFGEEVMWQTPLSLNIEVIDSHRHDAVNATMRSALKMTLDDLALGWLPLGAGGSRGLGVMLDDSGHGPQWTDGGVWINAGTDGEES